jgi:hypothetical protein
MCQILTKMHSPESCLITLYIFKDKNTEFLTSITGLHHKLVIVEQEHRPTPKAASHLTTVLRVGPELNWLSDTGYSTCPASLSDV